MQSVWDYPDFDDHEIVHFITDPNSGLCAVIAVHSTALGPGAGGVRFWHYPDPGKAVILANEVSDKTPAMLAAYGRAVERLGGAYVTAEDVGMTVQDLVAVSKQTRHIAGLPVAED